jgi:hypothetical protein
MKRILLLVFTFISLHVFGQNSIVRGVITNENNNAPIAEATITLKAAKVSTFTNALGEFSLSKLKPGSYEATIEADGFETEITTISVTGGSESIGTIALTPSIVAPTDIAADVQQATGVQDGTDEDNSSAGSQNVGSALNASRDPFISAASFAWGNYFYRLRGYENDQNVVFLNGIPMNDLEEGLASFSAWSGLNDVFRSRVNTLGLAAGESGFGGLGITTAMDATASSQRKQTRVTYSLTNRSYRNRLMLTHNSGMNKQGWAYSLSLSKRWATEGPIAGTTYDSYGYFAAVEKKHRNHMIALTAFGVPTKRGKASPAMQEAITLSGDNNYNPNWGYMSDGTKRNAKVANTHVPVIMLNDDFKLSEKTKIQAAISYQTGGTAQSAIDWYNSADPRPDYYRYMPSYISLDTGVGNNAANDVAAYLQANPEALQINWPSLYAANEKNVETNQGVTGKRSNYILADDVEKQNKLSGTINLQSAVRDNLTLFGGVNFQNQRNHNYKRVNDLLGGDYYMNVNQFNERNFGISNISRINLKDNNLIVREGDTYNYDYNTVYNKQSAWAQAVLTTAKLDFFGTATISHSNFYRVGNYESGLYADSYGKSKNYSFVNYGAKGGITYKLNGRNYLYANGGLLTRAPYVDNVFINSRSRNEAAVNPTSEKVQSMEAGYLLRSPNLKGRLGFYATDIKNAMDIKRFYDDDAYSFVAISMRGINKRYTGLELGIEAKVSPQLSINLAGALGQAFYTGRYSFAVYNDNDTLSSTIGTATGQVDTAYIKNFFVPNGPQQTATLGFNYRSPKFWFANINFNYLGNNYIDFAPINHSIRTLDLLKQNFGEDVFNQITSQKKLNTVYTVDVFFGKSWLARKIIKSAPYRSTLNLNIGVNNLLNNKNIQLLGFEQLRSDATRPTLFAPKYMYAIGAQYFLNLAYTF